MINLSDIAAPGTGPGRIGARKERDRAGAPRENPARRLTTISRLGQTDVGGRKISAAGETCGGSHEPGTLTRAGPRRMPRVAPIAGSAVAATAWQQPSSDESSAGTGAGAGAGRPGTARPAATTCSAVVTAARAGISAGSTRVPSTACASAVWSGHGDAAAVVDTPTKQARRSKAENRTRITVAVSLLYAPLSSPYLTIMGRNARLATHRTHQRKMLIAKRAGSCLDRKRGFMLLTMRRIRSSLSLS